jgi:DNA-binding CsgD family transcriptional regulator
MGSQRRERQLVATALSRRDAACVRRMREILEVYRPSARPVAEEFLDDLCAAVDGEASFAMRPVLSELGWSFDFLYSNVDTSPLRELVSRFTTPWTPFFPVTPVELRNRALRPKVIHAHLIANPPTPEYQALVEAVERTPGYGIKRDDLAVSVCDDDVPLGWFGVARIAPFGPRELALLDAVIPQLRARMLLEHPIGRPAATQVLLEAALEAIPAAAFILAGTTIAHANATGRLLLDRDRASVVQKLRESLRPGGAVTPFAITSVESPGCSPTSLAVMRPDGTGDIDGRLASFGADHALTPRQLEVLSLIARGYGNKTIAGRMGVAVGTIEEHVAHVLRKTGTDSRSALVARLWTR